MLEFEVSGQRLLLKRQPYTAADSVNYLTAKFVFSEDWTDLGKTAVFKTADKSEVYNVVLDSDGECSVPSEVICAPKFYVSVYSSGGVRITTNDVEVLCKVSGYSEGAVPEDPTPSVYDQILGELNKRLAVNGDASNTTVEFDVSAEKENIVSGETLKTLFGKIAGWFSYIGEVISEKLQPDWAQNDTTAEDYIKNKPTKLSQFFNDLVSGWALQPTKPKYTAEEVGALPVDTELFDGKYSSLEGAPTALSKFINDKGFIDNAVNNLVNYYLKSEVYTRAEVADMIEAVTTMNILVVDKLPIDDISTRTIYFLPNGMSEGQNVHDEYIYVNGKWEIIGSTQIELSDYYTKSEVDGALDGKLDATATAVAAIADGKGNNIVETYVTMDDFDNLPTGQTWYCGSNVANSAGWYKFMSKTFEKTHEDLNVTLVVNSDYSIDSSGILKIRVRKENTAININQFGWLTRSGWSTDSVIGIVNTDTATVDFYIKTNVVQYSGITFSVLSKSNIGADTKFDMISSKAPTTETLIPTKTSTDIGIVSQSASAYALTYHSQVVGETTDWNTLKEGVHRVGFDSSKFSADYHAPVGAYGWGEVFCLYTPQGKTQIYFPDFIGRAELPPQGKTVPYIRSGYGEAWRDWTYLPTKTELDTKLDKSGGTITGNLEVDGYITGEPFDTNYNKAFHGIKLGSAGRDYVDFQEYGGVYNFYKTTQYEQTLLGKITVNGWEGKVNGENILPNRPASSTPYDAGRVWLNGAPIKRLDFCVVVKEGSEQHLDKRVFLSAINSAITDVTVIDVFANAYLTYDYVAGEDVGISIIDGYSVTYDNTCIDFEDFTRLGYSALTISGYVEYVENCIVPAVHVTKVFE